MAGKRRDFIREIIMMIVNRACTHKTSNEETQGQFQINRTSHHTIQVQNYLYANFSQHFTAGLAECRGICTGLSSIWLGRCKRLSKGAIWLGQGLSAGLVWPLSCTRFAVETYVDKGAREKDIKGLGYNNRGDSTMSSYIAKWDVCIPCQMSSPNQARSISPREWESLLLHSSLGLICILYM